MTRPRRVAFEGAIHHVTGRGNDRQPIFTDQLDHESFLTRLAAVSRRMDLPILSYALMPNHFHLLVETPRANLPAGMHALNGWYAQKWRRRHGGTGHLFEKRYHSALVTRDHHLFATFLYVANNPVKAALCDRPEDWRWSGHRALCGLEAAHPALAGGRALSWFDTEEETARARYAALFDGQSAEVEPPRLVSGLPVPARPALAALLSSGDVDDAILFAHRTHGYPVREIAEVLDCHPSTVSRRMAKVVARARNARAWH